MIHLISYDISDDRLRRDVARLLEAHGHRVQFSVFECELHPDRVERLETRLAKLVRPPGDSVRLYTICEADFRRIRVIGAGGVERVPPFRMI